MYLPVSGFEPTSSCVPRGMCYSLSQHGYQMRTLLEQNPKPVSLHLHDMSYQPGIEGIGVNFIHWPCVSYHCWGPLTLQLFMS